MRIFSFSFSLFVFLVAALSAHAQFNEEEERLQDPKPGEFQFIGFSFTRTTATNVTPTNDVLQGQVIGRMFGRNSTETVNRTAAYSEQRFVPLFVYRPSILDGVATFRSLFKIDYTWGDQAYGVGNNRGGGLNAGQVNLQTLMANVDIRLPEKPWNLVVGLQRIFGSAYDPNVNALSLFQNTGYKLSFWGTQAVGASWFTHPHPAIYGRIGFFQLWENNVADDDDVFMGMADLMTRPHHKMELGFSAWYLRDTGKNRGGISVLGQGLTSALAEYNGATRIRLPGNSQNYAANILWLGSNMSWNRDFVTGPFNADAYLIANVGTIDPEDQSQDDISLFGYSANARLAYKYGMTNRDKIWLEGLYTSGDGNGANDGSLGSVLTGNVWGSPVGIYSTHRSLLLFPDPQVVSRYYSMVHDISNQGLGVAGVFVNGSKDLIPHKLALKVGAATAFSNFSLENGGNVIGTEFNAELTYDIKVFLSVGLSTAYVAVGDFYDSPLATDTGVTPINPWVSFLTLSWLMF